MAMMTENGTRARDAAGVRGGGVRARGVDVAVIGAGPGGLSAAVLLAASGAKVTVYEAEGRIGGRTAQLEARGGGGEVYRFDRGPTFFLMPYVLEEVFAAAGRRLTEYVELKRLDPMYRLVIGKGARAEGERDVVLDATQDVAEMARRIGTINAHDGQAFARFIADNRYKLRHSESILRNPMRSPVDLFRGATWLDTLKVGPVLNPHLSVHQLLAKYFEDPAVRLAVCFQSKYLGMSPYECPSLFTILPFIEYEYGVWHPIGGCHALMRALARVAEELGVEIRTGAAVERVEFAGRRATGVVVRGERRGHDQVVINADAAWALKKLIPAELRPREGLNPAGGPGYDDAGLDSRRYSCSTFMLYLGVDGKLDLPHHTICISGGYERNLEEITTLGTLSEDPSVYVCNPSRLDPTMAPDGQSAVYVLLPCANLKQSAGKIDWEREAQEARRRALAQIGRMAGVKYLEGRIRAELMVTPRDWAGMNINFGATFNLAHNLGQMLHKRPQNKLPFVENVYLVGGGTHPGSGLPTIFLSSQISARLLCDAAGLRYAGESERVREISRARAVAGLG